MSDVNSSFYAVGSMKREIYEIKKRLDYIEAILNSIKSKEDFQGKEVIEKQRNKSGPKPKERQHDPK